MLWVFRKFVSTIYPFSIGVRWVLLLCQLTVDANLQAMECKNLSEQCAIQVMELSRVKDEVCLACLQN
jgi:hypothetical protein